jgi:hypothetical protein
MRIVLQLHFIDCQIAAVFYQLQAYSVGSGDFFRPQDTVPVNEACLDHFPIVVNYEDINGIYQLVISDVREKIRLHYCYAWFFVWVHFILH